MENLDVDGVDKDHDENDCDDHDDGDDDNEHDQDEDADADVHAVTQEDDGEEPENQQTLQERNVEQTRGTT